MKHIIVKQTGKVNRTFKVTNPKKIEFWKMMAVKVGPYGTWVRTEILEEKK